MENISEKQINHYYGDIVRKIFLFVGVVMLVIMPTVTGKFGVPIHFWIFSIVVLGIAAGVTNPVQRGSLFFNVIVSIIGLATFIYISLYLNSNGFRNFLLFLNQALAVLFLIAAYLSVKSLRGYVLRK